MCAYVSTSNMACWHSCVCYKKDSVESLLTFGWNESSRWLKITSSGHNYFSDSIHNTKTMCIIVATNLVLLCNKLYEYRSSICARRHNYHIPLAWTSSYLVKDSPPLAGVWVAHPSHKQKYLCSQLIPSLVGALLALCMCAFLGDNVVSG